jgi:hypothetical protein
MVTIEERSPAAAGKLHYANRQLRQSEVEEKASGRFGRDGSSLLDGPKEFSHEQEFSGVPRYKTHF